LFFNRSSRPQVPAMSWSCCVAIEASTPQVTAWAGSPGCWCRVTPFPGTSSNRRPAQCAWRASLRSVRPTMCGSRLPSDLQSTVGSSARAFSIFSCG
jgi:hypothetical protein